MLNKTKATMQGRQCHFSNIAENNITQANQVNARRFAHIFSDYGQPIEVAAAMAQPDFSRASLIRWFYSASSAPSKVKGGVSIIGHTPQGVINSLISSRNAIGDTGITVSGERHRAGGADLPTVSGLAQPQNEVTEEIRDLPIHAEAFPQIGGDRQSPEKSGGQPFFLDSLFSFWRQASFTQELKLPEPADSLISASRSSSKRIFFFVLPERSKDGLLILSCIGTYQYIRINRNGTYRDRFTQPLKSTKPSGALTLAGPLTKPLTGVTTMAEQQHTQTHTKFTWRFLAIDRADMAAKPCRLSVEAATEKDARRVLAPHFILSLAARLPVVEVCHA
ncbi:host cell division inhibitor Icd-like protein [Pantoea agglomerans]|uniref:host cell division inhibitor Icd-like protein n=1 Tax=Enterobacter agglomerans TaxID=549 RepID=UPI003BFA6C53